MRILKIHNDWLTNPERKAANSWGGCGYYRTIKIAEQLSPEHEVTVWGREWEEKYNEFGKDNEKFFSSLAREYDMIWMHYTDNPITFSWLRVACDRYRAKLVIDIDDNFLEVDKNNPSLKLQNRGKLDTTNKVAMLATILSFADAITVSTVPLKKALFDHIKQTQKIEKQIFVIPNYNDIRDWDFPLPEKNEVTIGYSGGLSHKSDLAMILPAMKKVLLKYPYVRFQIMGQMDMLEAKNVFAKWPQHVRSRILLMNATRTQPEYPKYLSEQPWSIGIAPLVSSPFNESKSHIKWLEYSSVKLPILASRVYPYCKYVLGFPTIEDTVTGFLANDDEWEEKLSFMIENPDLCKKMGEQAYTAVLKNWQYKDGKTRILDVVAQIEAL